MRKLIGCGILVLSALVVSASSAWAAPIPVGELTFTANECEDDCIFGGFFSIVNQSGANQQPGVFPILDQVDFSTITLTIDGSPVLLTDVFADGYNFDSDPTFGPSSALIGGAAPAGPYTVQGGGGFIGGKYLFSGNFFLSPNNPVNVGDISSAENESAIIYIEGRRIERQVPEPVSLGLLGSGLVGLYLRRRSAKRS
jgi:hypothetical protein